MANWLDSLLDRSNEAKQVAEPQRAVIAKPLTQRQPTPEIKTVWFQTARPRDDDDPGRVEEGLYSVLDNVVRMHDSDGKLAGVQQRLGDDENERVVAARLAKALWQKTRGESDFNRPLHYADSRY